MAGAGKKTFTAGETLTASDVNTYLMEQSVMYFGGTAARASAIPTPSTGMTTYIGVTGTATIPQIETYTGSQWQTPYGLTQVANVPFSAVSSVSINNIFTSAYKDYVIYLTTTSASASGTTSIQLRYGSSNISGTNYQYNLIYGGFNSGPASINTPSGAATSIATIPSGGSTPCSAVVTFINPQLNIETDYHWAMVDGVNGNYGNGNGRCTDTTVCDGFTVFRGTGTFGGTIRVYGLRNS